MSALGVALVTALAPAGVAAPQARVELGPLLRVQTPGGTATTCPFESEPELTSTAAGTWVAYNDDVGCPMYGAGKATRMTGLQLVPPHGPRRDITLPALHGDERYAGDPDLAPAPDGRGGVLLSTLVASRADNAYRVAVVDVSRTGRARLLPSPSLGTSDDKEFLAVDNNPRSRFRGRVYLAWDDFANAATTVRAFVGGRWSTRVRLHDVVGEPDVSVGPNGEVAVVDLSNTGIEVHMSYDGGRTFSTGREAISGDWPGRDDPSCELGTAVAQRQRVIKSPRAAWDRDGRLHVVGAFSTPDGISATASGSVGTLAGGEARVMHAVSADGGRSFSRPDAVAPSTEQQWAPAIAALPGGGVAVSFLQTAQVTSYDAVVAVLGPGARAFGTPLLLSDGHGPLPPAMEAVGNAPCYGIGDYTGLAPTSDGVVAAWPTTVGVETSFLDSDIAVREVHALAR